MSRFTHRLIIIVPASEQARANTAALIFDQSGGANTFTAGLSADGQLPATHFWCSALVTPEVYSGIQQTLSAQFPLAVAVDWSLETERAKPGQLLAQHGLKCLQKPVAVQVNSTP